MSNEMYQGVYSNTEKHGVTKPMIREMLKTAYKRQQKQIRKGKIKPIERWQPLVDPRATEGDSGVSTNEVVLVNYGIENNGQSEDTFAFDFSELLAGCGSHTQDTHTLRLARTFRDLKAGDEDEVSNVIIALSYITNRTVDPLTLAAVMIAQRNSNQLEHVSEPVLRQFADRAAVMSLHSLQLTPFPPSRTGEDRIKKIERFRAQILSQKYPQLPIA